MATITFTVLADEDPELAEKVTITLLNVATIGIDDASRGATINPERAQALIIILPNGSPFGVIGWHSDSYYIVTEEPLGNDMLLSSAFV